MWQYNYTIPSDELYHYGVKGMKWGVRRTPEQLEYKKARKEEIKNFKSDHKRRLDEIKKSQIAKDTKEAYRQYSFNNDRKSYIQYQQLNNRLKSMKKSENERYKKELEEKYPEEARKDKIKKGVIATAAVLAVIGTTTLAVAGAKKSAFEGNYMANSLREGMKKIKIEDLDDVDISIPKGTQFHRMSSRKVEDYSKATRIYAAYKKDDVARYKSMMPDFIKKWHSQGLVTSTDTYDHTLKAANDILSPSKKKRVQAFADLLKNEGFVNELASDFGLDPSAIKADIASRGVNKFAENNYKEFSAALTSKTAKSVKTYFDKVASMGYNAIVDDNDANKLSSMPMILLDPNNNFIKEGSKKVGFLNRINAYLHLKNVV